MRALVVDDSAVIVAQISHVLLEAGFDVVAAVDGAEGFTAFERDEFDLIVTDITMPICDGIAMTEKIRQSGSRVPIVFVTAADDWDYVDRARNAGADSYLIKPVESAQLRRRLAELRLPMHASA